MATYYTETKDQTLKELIKTLLEIAETTGLDAITNIHSIEYQKMLSSDKYTIDIIILNN